MILQDAEAPHTLAEVIARAEKAVTGSDESANTPQAGDVESGAVQPSVGAPEGVSEAPQSPTVVVERDTAPVQKIDTPSEQTLSISASTPSVAHESFIQRAMYDVRRAENSLLSLVGKGDDTVPLGGPLKQINDLEPRMRAMSDTQLQGMTTKFKARLAAGESLDSIMPEAYAVVREASRRVLGMRPFDVQVMGGIAMNEGKVIEMKTGEGKTLTATMPAYLNALTGKGVHVVTVNQTLAERDATNMGKLYSWLGLSVGCVPEDPLKTDAKRNAYNCDISYVTNFTLGFDFLRDHMTRHREDRVCRDPNFALVDEVDEILIDEARTPLIISQMEEPSTSDYERFAKIVGGLKPGADFKVDYQKRVAWLTDEGLVAVEKQLGIDNLYDKEHEHLLPYMDAALKARTLFQKDKDYMVADGKVTIVDEFTGRVMDGRRFNDGLHQALEAKEGVQVQAEQKTMASITYPNLFRRYKKVSGMSGTAKTEESEFQNLYGMSVAVIPPNKTSIRVDKPDLVYKTYQEKFNAVVNEVERLYNEGKPVLIGTRNVATNEYLHKLLEQRGIQHQLLNARSVQENTSAENEIIALAGKSGMVTLATNMAGRGVDIKPDLVDFKMLTLEAAKAVQAGQRVVVVLPSPKDETIVRPVEQEVKDARLWLGANQLQVVDGELKTSEVAAGAPLFAGVAGGGEQPGQSAAPQVQIVVDDGTPLGNVPGAVVLNGSDEKFQTGGLHIIGTERHEARRIDNQLKGRSGRQGDPGETQFFVSLDDELLRLFGGDKLKKIFDRLGVPANEAVSDSLLDKAIGAAQKKIEGMHFEVRKDTTKHDQVLNEHREMYYADRDDIVDGKTDIGEQIPGWVEEGIDEALEEAHAGKHVNAHEAAELWTQIKERTGVDDSLKPACLAGGSEVSENRIEVATLRKQVLDGVDARLKDLHQKYVSTAVDTMLTQMRQSVPAMKQAMMGEIQRLAAADPQKARASQEELNKTEAEAEKQVLRSIDEYQAKLAPQRDKAGEGMWQDTLRNLMLDRMDEAWFEHLENMQAMQSGIGWVSYGQQDPWVEYQKQALELWNGMKSVVEADVTKTVLTSDLSPKIDIPTDFVPQVVGSRARAADPNTPPAAG